MPSLPSSLIVIGASTGGTRVLPRILARLPVLRAAVVIVQHMPEFITRSFAQSLQRESVMPVRTAATEDRLVDGEVLLAPGGWHCEVVRNEQIAICDGPKVNFVKPAIDVTMRSVQPVPRLPGLCGVILTGLGRDGADGMVHFKRLGALTLAQDQASAAVYGMPSAAVATGCVDQVMDPENIADTLARRFS